MELDKSNAFYYSWLENITETRGDHLSLTIILKFEIIVYLQEVVRNNTEKVHVPLTQFPLIVTTWKIILQHHTQDIDIDSVKVKIIFIITRIPHITLL
jgi:urea transporter